VPCWTSVQSTLRPGVVLQVRSVAQKMKYQLELDAGVTPDGLVLTLPTADQIAIGDVGELIIKVGDHQLLDAAPIAWQQVGEHRQFVEVKWEIITDAHAMQLIVGDFDPELPLIIDPEMLLLCGFIGGSLEEEGRGIGVDQLGNLFVTGWTHSNDMPVKNAWQNNFGGGTQDVWAAKVTPNGQFDFLTYLGGNAQDLPYDLSMDPAGNAYVVGGHRFNQLPVSQRPRLGAARRVGLLRGKNRHQRRAGLQRHIRRQRIR